MGGRGNPLDGVVVTTVRKGFWDSDACRVFPRRIYAGKILRRQHSSSTANSLPTAVRVFLHLWLRRPRLIVFGSTVRIVPWFLNMRRRRLLPPIKMIAINQICFPDALAAHVDKVVVYARSDIETHDPGLRDKYVFMPLAADGRFNDCIRHRGDYIFSGGGEGRDFPSLIDAVRGQNVALKIVTFSSAALGYGSPLPENCSVSWTKPLGEFLNMLGGARFVVVPLRAGLGSHGQTTIVQSLSLGKAVITTRDASVGDYVHDGVEGLLVAPGDINGYRNAINRLLLDTTLLDRLERNAQMAAREFAYEKFAARLTSLCLETLGENDAGA